MHILGKGAIIVLLLSSVLIAKVTSFVNTNTIQAGDLIKFTIESNSEDTKFPKIDSILGYPIISTPTSKQSININGKVTVINSQSYVFKPLKDVTIPSFRVKVDGKIYNTKEEIIKVKKRTQTINKQYKFTIKVDNKNPYMDEEIKLIAQFEIDETIKLEALDVNLDMLDGFWVQDVEDNWRGQKNGSKITYKRVFYIYAQKEGEIIIPNYPIVGQISEGRKSFFFNGVKNFSAYSNELKLNIKPLPANVNLVGNFKMSVKTDKFKTTAKEPINLSVEIEGYGNLDAYEMSKIEIDGVTIYDDKPQATTTRKKDKLFSKIIYKYALVSDANFTIPSFSFTFMQPKNNRVKTISSNQINIEVENSKISSALSKKTQVVVASTNTKQIQEASSDTSLYIYFTLGALLGLLVGLFLSMLKNRNFHWSKKETIGTKNSPFQNIKSSKNSKELLGHILRYVDDKEFQEVIAKLEKDITKTEFKTIKKDVAKLFDS